MYLFASVGNILSQLQNEMGLWCGMRSELRNNRISEVSFILVDKAEMDVCWHTIKSKRDWMKEKKQKRKIFRVEQQVESKAAFWG